MAKIKAKAKKEAPVAKEASKSVVRIIKIKAVATIDKKAEQQKFQAATVESLGVTAKEINARLEKAAGLDGKADDHRLAAAIALGLAKTKCQEAKLSFEEWCAKNIEDRYSWESVRKLAVIGQSDKPAETLADLRGRTNEAQKKHQKKKKQGSATISAGKTPKVTPFRAASEALTALGDKAITLVEDHAAKHGLRVVSDEKAKEYDRLAKTTTEGGLKAMKANFLALSAKDQMTMVEWAALEIGFEVKNPLTAGADPNDLFAIPAALRKRKEVDEPSSAEATSGMGSAAAAEQPRRRRVAT